MITFIVGVIEILLLIFSVWLISIVSLGIHELGHAFGHDIGVRNMNWKIELGTGSMLVETKRLIIRILPVSGHFRPVVERYKSTEKAILTLLCGPFATLFVLLLLLIARSLSSIASLPLLNPKATIVLINYALIYNLQLFLVSALPFKWQDGPYHDYISDGLKIRNMLSKS